MMDYRLVIVFRPACRMKSASPKQSRAGNRPNSGHFPVRLAAMLFVGNTAKIANPKIFKNKARRKPTQSGNPFFNEVSMPHVRIATMTVEMIAKNKAD
jgi:hypothetical protein